MEAKSRRIIGVLWGALALVTGVPGHAAAVITLTPATATATPGGTVNVGVGVSDLTSTLGAFDLSITFDPGLFSSAGVSFGPQLGNPAAGEAFSGSKLASPGVVQLAEVSLLSAAALGARQSSSFSLATLSFNAIANGNGGFGVASAVLADAAGNPISVVPEMEAWLFVLAGLGLGAYQLRRKTRADPKIAAA